MKFPIQMYDPTRDYNNYKDQYDKEIHDVLNEGYFIGGHQIKDLEKKLSNYINAKHCITVANGTDALLVALLALDIKAGDEVITVAHTWISTSEVIALIGAIPVFVDIEPETFTMDPTKIESKITSKTKAIMPVCLYGHMYNFSEINKIANKYNIPVIEDAAQSYGAKYNNIYSCNIATISCTSFFPSKPLGCYGDAGACFTNNDLLADKIKAIKNHGALVRFHHDYIGLNARLDTIQAGILLVKLTNFNKCLQNRNQVADYYAKRLGVLGNRIILPKTKQGHYHTWAQYSIILENNNVREYMFNKLKENKINIAIFYPAPLHLQNCFKYLGYQKNDFPITENICDTVINLPCYAELTQEEQNYICDKFIESLHNYSILDV